MPTNQTLEFSAATGLTLSCKLFALGSDTVVDTQTATEKANDKNRYSVVFVDIPAGAYRLNAYVGATGGFANEVYDLTLNQITFYPRSEAALTVVPPTGARSVAITVRDTDNVAIQGATVRLERAGYAYTLTTNASGLVTFSVDDATYTVTITAGGFSFTPVSLVVAANVTQTYQMTSIALIQPPAFAGLCNVLFSVIHLGQALANASVNAILEDENPTVNNYLISRQVTSGLTDVNGNCVLTMVQYSQFTRGGVYRIKVADSLGRVIHDRKVTVPTSSTANAEDLPDAR